MWQVQVSRANVFISQRLWEEAHDSLDRALVHNAGGAAFIHEKKGDVYKEQGSCDEAADQYERARAANGLNRNSMQTQQAREELVATTVRLLVKEANMREDGYKYAEAFVLRVDAVDLATAFKCSSAVMGEAIWDLVKSMERFRCSPYLLRKMVEYSEPMLIGGGLRHAFGWIERLGNNEEFEGAYCTIVASLQGAFAGPRVAWHEDEVDEALENAKTFMGLEPENAQRKPCIGVVGQNCFPKTWLLNRLLGCETPIFCPSFGHTEIVAEHHPHSRVDVKMTFIGQDEDFEHALELPCRVNEHAEVKRRRMACMQHFGIDEKTVTTETKLDDLVPPAIRTQIGTSETLYEYTDVKSAMDAVRKFHGCAPRIIKRITVYSNKFEGLGVGMSLRSMDKTDAEDASECGALVFTTTRLDEGIAAPFFSGPVAVCVCESDESAFPGTYNGMPVFHTRNASCVADCDGKKYAGPWSVARWASYCGLRAFLRLTTFG